MSESNYRRAIAQMVLDEARCEHCGAANRPGAHVIEMILEPHGVVFHCQRCGEYQQTAWPEAQTVQ